MTRESISHFDRRPSLRRRFVPRLELLEDRTVLSATGVGAFDPATATWFLRDSPSPGAPNVGQFQYGPPGSIAVVGDWDGNGQADIGVVDPRTMTWYLHRGIGPGAADAGVFQYGGPGTIPVVGDWNGDGKTDIGVVEPTTMTWMLHFGAGPAPPTPASSSTAPPTPRRSSATGTATARPTLAPSMRT